MASNKSKSIVPVSGFIQKIGPGAVSLAELRNAALARLEQTRDFLDAKLTLTEVIARMERHKRVEKKELALAANSSAIAEMHSQDALEQARVAMGLDKGRDELFKELCDRMSVEEGLAMFSSAARRLGIKAEFSSIGELNAYYPAVTCEELAMLSLAERVPATFLKCGSVLEKTIRVPAGSKINMQQLIEIFNQQVASGEIDPSKGILGEFGEVLGDSKLLPLIFALTVDGIQTCANDFKQLGFDPFVKSGFTNVEFGLEPIGYRREVRKIIRDLVLLSITNERVHDKCKEFASSTAVSHGYTVLMKKAYEMSGLTLDFSTDDYEETERKISDKKRQQIERHLLALEKKITNLTLIELDTGERLSPLETLGFLGLIGAMPPHFAARKRFAGYFKPYGFGVKLINPDGRLSAYYPYRRNLVRESVYEMNEETDGSDNRTNKTMLKLWQRIMQHVKSDIINARIAEGKPLSLIEEKALQLLENHGVLIDPAYMPAEVREIDDKLIEMLGRHGLVLTDKREHEMKRGFKIGIQELEMIDSFLSGLPPEMVRSNLRSIGKEEEVGTIYSKLIMGFSIAGTYKNKRITIKEDYAHPFSQLDDFGKLVQLHVLAHEMGEAVWESLGSREKEEFRRISAAVKRTEDGKSARERRHFLTWYSRISGVNDDFAEHFSAYVLHGSEFRERARESKPLSRKYGLLKRVFASYSGGSDVEFSRDMGSIDEIMTKVDARIRAETEGVATACEHAENFKRERKAWIMEMGALMSIEGLRDSKQALERMGIETSELRDEGILLFGTLVMRFEHNEKLVEMLMEQKADIYAAYRSCSFSYLRELLENMAGNREDEKRLLNHFMIAPTKDELDALLASSLPNLDESERRMRVEELLALFDTNNGDVTSILLRVNALFDEQKADPDAKTQFFTFLEGYFSDAMNMLKGGEEDVRKVKRKAAKGRKKKSEEDEDDARMIEDYEDYFGAEAHDGYRDRSDEFEETRRRERAREDRKSREADYFRRRRNAARREFFEDFHQDY